MKTCSTCQRVDVEAINADLLMGKSLGDVAAKYGVAKSNIARHAKHIERPSTDPDTFIAEARSALMKILQVEARVNALYALAMGSNDPKLALDALKEHRQVIGLSAKLSGELNQQTVHQHLHVTAAPEWLSLRALMMDALMPYPDARAALVAAIGGDEQ